MYHSHHGSAVMLALTLENRFETHSKASTLSLTHGLNGALELLLKNCKKSHFIIIFLYVENC